MTTVTDTTSTAAATTTAVAKPKIGSDFDMFLKLLTTQMQNQDPLKPMDSTEYTQQLAQFSQVEQTVQQTGTLKDILARLTTQDLSQAAALIGREGSFDTPVSGRTDAVPAQWNYGPTGTASTVIATITDTSGRIVATSAIDPASAGGRFTWDGTQADGSKATAGAYTLAIKAKDAADGDIDVTVKSVGTIKAVTGNASTAMLTVNGFAIDKAKLVGVADLGG